MGDQIHLSLTCLQLQYGDVFQMHMGSLVVVVLVQQGEAIAGRTDLFTFSTVANGTSMTFSEKYGAACVLHKKLCKNALCSFSHAELRGPGTTCLLKEHVCAEAARMVEVIWEHSEGSEGLGLDLVVPLVTSVAKLVCVLCFGKRYDYNDTEFLTIVHINNEVLQIFAAGNLDCIRDITDALIALCEERQEDEVTAVLSNSQIIHTVTNIFGAGDHIGPARLPRDLWGDPDVFCPERFLGEEGLLNKDLTEKVMIFGMG
ncbi:unnamed protein product [Coregonus sp. 'balchen']|nr:unnamed protein product [Coregonus sp. 'balchen']